MKRGGRFSTLDSASVENRGFSLGRGKRRDRWREWTEGLRGRERGGGGVEEKQVKRKGGNVGMVGGFQKLATHAHTYAQAEGGMMRGFQHHGQCHSQTPASVDITGGEERGEGWGPSSDSTVHSLGKRHKGYDFPPNLLPCY